MTTALRRAAVVSTGSEILQGLYADTNARWLAERMSAMGLEVTAIVAAPDDLEQAKAALRFAAANADLVVCSGGLGPTEDDVNRDAFADVFGCRLVEDAEALHQMRERFMRRRGPEVPIPDRNALQALVPEGATVFQNANGTAPGYFLPSRDGVPGLIALPGPPKELMPMWTGQAEPLLAPRVADAGAFVRTRTLHTFGRAESAVNAAVSDLFRRDADVLFTILAKTYGVDLRITARAATAAATDARIAEYEATVRERLGAADLYGTDGSTLADAVVTALAAAGATVSTAESCTGGLLAKMITDTAGASRVFDRGVVTYADDVKQELLGVKSETLEAHGAVSEAVAVQMADGCLRTAGSDYALAITGVAGPDGGSAEKPVGRVHIALARLGEATVSRRCDFLGDRELVRLHAALTALDMLRRAMARADV